MAPPVRETAQMKPKVTETPSDRFWQRKRPGFKEVWTVDKLYGACVEYFDWAHDHPLQEAKPFAYKGDSWVEEVNKARAFTIGGLCTFIGITVRQWGELVKQPDMTELGEWVEQVIHQQKFELAATDLLNANFIARDLGMSDKRELGGIEGKPLEISARDQLLDRLAGIAAQAGDS